MAHHGLPVHQGSEQVDGYQAQWAKGCLHLVNFIISVRELDESVSGQMALEYAYSDVYLWHNYSPLQASRRYVTHHHDRAPVVRRDDLNNVDRGGEDAIAQTNKNSVRKVIKDKYNDKYNDKDKDKYKVEREEVYTSHNSLSV